VITNDKDRKIATNVTR